MDNFTSLSNRLLSRCPNVGLPLSMQFVNDAWHTLQARRQWSFRRKGNTFAPPDIYTLGQVSTNRATGNPLQITGIGTAWTPDMVGRQIRIGGLLYPFYTIAGYLSSTSLLLDQPWAGPDVMGQSYQMLQCYFPVPEDFGYWYAIVSIKDSYRLYDNLTQSDLAVLDPQRTNFGQTYAVAFRDYTAIQQGFIGPAIPVNVFPGPPITTTTDGYNLPIVSTYIVQVIGSGFTGAATFVWTKVGTSGFSSVIATSADPQDLSDGVQIYWPTGINWGSGSLWVITATPAATVGVPRYELWPAPTFSAYLYPYQYIAKESDLTVANPQLPPFMANRGEVLLEMALEKCAEFPGQDADHLNIYHDLRQAQYHRGKYLDMLVDLERNDEEVAVSNIDYQMFPLYPAPWMTGQWQQTHAPFLE